MPAKMLKVVGGVSPYNSRLEPTVLRAAAHPQVSPLILKERNQIMSEKFEAITGKNFDSPDETRQPFEKGRIDVITVGGLTFYRETLEPGWQWSKHVKPVVGGESCQRFHVKIFLAGQQRIRMYDGTEMEFGPGDVAIMQPGHDAWIVGDEPNVLIELADVV